MQSNMVMNIIYLSVYYGIIANSLKNQKKLESTPLALGGNMHFLTFHTFVVTFVSLVPAKTNGFAGTHLKSLKIIVNMC